MNLLFEIDEYPGYFVGTDLNIYSERRGSIKMLKQSLDNNGYYYIKLKKDKIEYHNLIHRLIAQTFIPNPNNLPCIDHINQYKHDNRPCNLRWVTHKDNSRNRDIGKNNTSGILGVRFDSINNRWIAEWTDKQGKRQRKSFSIKKYGDNAKQLAIDFRKMKVDEFYNRPK